MGACSGDAGSGVSICEFVIVRVCECVLCECVSVLVCECVVARMGV